MRKQIVNLLGIVLLSLVAVLAGLIVFPRLLIFSMEYSERFIECDPQQMVAHLERVFDIDFPEEIREVKTATSRSSWLKRNTISFIVKFNAEPHAVDTFLESFPEKTGFHAYERARDTRLSLPRTPKWFKKPIRRGKFNGGGSSGRGKNITSIYIDTGNEEGFIVYLRGFYRHDLEK